MFNIRIGKVAIWFSLFIQIQVSGVAGRFLRDQTSPRTNTLFDDADDIQRQLDNEARDRIRCGKPPVHWPDITEMPTTLKTEKTIQPFLWGRMLKLFPDAVGNRIIEVSPKTIWVFHFPSHISTENSLVNSEHYVKKAPKDKSQSVTVPLRYRSGSQVGYTADMGRLHPSVSDDVEESVFIFPHWWSRPKSLNRQDFDIYSMASQLQTRMSWDYKTQRTWSRFFPHCKGRSQSPVNLPVRGLLKARGGRPLFFEYYNEQPKTMMIQTDGQRAILYGVWPPYRRPLIYGGAVHSRRYLFHSMTVHWPSEHRVGGQVYPVETQALFISSEYKTIQKALDGYPRDSQAILGISSLYKYGNHTHKGLEKLMMFTNTEEFQTQNFTAKPLTYFNPPFSKYVCYQGSLTVPPCTETVIWLVRARALSVKREFIDSMEAVLNSEPVPRRPFLRFPQPINDRKVFIFT